MAIMTFEHNVAVITDADAVIFEGDKRAMPEQIHRVFLVQPKK